jgi:hypothetical protein
MEQLQHAAQEARASRDKMKTGALDRLMIVLERQKTIDAACRIMKRCPKITYDTALRRVLDLMCPGHCRLCRNHVLCDKSRKKG